MDQKLPNASKLLDKLAENPMLRIDDWKIIDQKLSEALLSTAASLIKKRPRRPRGVNADKQ